MKITAERRKKKDEESKKRAEDKKKNPYEEETERKADLKPEDEEYMDDEMIEADERSRSRINIIFREFKNELDAYVPPGGEKSEKESSVNKQHLQDKLHLLKLSSLDKAANPDAEVCCGCYFAFILAHGFCNSVIVIGSLICRTFPRILHWRRGSVK